MASMPEMSAVSAGITSGAVLFQGADTRGSVGTSVER